MQSRQRVPGGKRLEDVDNLKKFDQVLCRVFGQFVVAEAEGMHRGRCPQGIQQGATLVILHSRLVKEHHLDVHVHSDGLYHGAEGVFLQT